jgi:glycosyltransferase involved in cell wall biosynthesis
MKVSVVVPVFNEEQSLDALYQELARVLDAQEWAAEIVFVDDGSRDGSFEILEGLAREDPRCTVVKFTGNFGQTAAMAAGIEMATGDVIVPIDADLQNDPSDIPRLIARLEDGYDVVSGWRRERRDRFLTKRLPSMLANRLISWWTGVRLHDYGCTLKAYRARVLKGTHLYGEMHRFVPVYAHWQGARVTEMVVNHRRRRFGRSNYGLSRTFKVLLDLLTLKLLGAYKTKPIYLFGGLGATFIAVGVLAFAGVVIEKLIWDSWHHKMSMLLLVTLLVTVGVMLIMMGLLAELMIRIYHEAQDKPTYVIDRVLSREAAGEGSREAAKR